MRIVQITTDSREHFKEYSRPYPYFGTAPTALFEGFQMLTDIEVHVISCIRQAIKSHNKVGKNIYFHSVFVPKIGWMSSGYYGCSRAIRSLCAKIKPDLVHGQGTERDCAMAAVLSGFPNILTLHGNMRAISRRPEYRKNLYYQLAAFLETFCLKRTNGVVAISSYTEPVS